MTKQKRIRVAAVTRQKNTELRDAAMYTRYKALYEGKRIRYDDVITAIAEEFYCSRHTVQDALRRAGTSTQPRLVDDIDI